MQKTQKFHASSTGRNGSEGHEPDAIREYARRRRIHQIAWIKAEGLPVIEPLTASLSPLSHSG